MKIIFIAGTDTGVGKSVVTGLLCRYLLDKGNSVISQKWVETGYKNGPSDIKTHIKFMGRRESDFKEYAKVTAPYRFHSPSSPHLASMIEKKKIDISSIKNSLKILSNDFDFVLIEGVGGLLVPLNSKTLLIDLVARLKLSVLLVAANKLGAINNTLLSLEALKARKIRTLGVIFNNIDSKQDKCILEDNPRIIKQFSDVGVFGALSRMRNRQLLQKEFEPIGNLIWVALNGRPYFT